MSLHFAKRMSSMQASEVRELLKITQQPEIISFAGGLPAPELFPVEEISHVAQIVLKEDGSRALQYSTTEGYQPLREWIANRMNTQLGTSFDKNNILITHGSQQAIDLTGKVFLDEGDVVFCECPTYLAALTAFRAYGCSFVEVPTNDNGMDMDILDNLLAKTPRAKLIYIIPDFQNPTGETWSLKKRKQLAEIAARHNVAVLEDNPYGDLRYEGSFLPSIQSFDTADCILFTGTFSKIFCPGYRIAWLAGEKELIKKFVLAKQAVDLQCNTLAQIEISKYLELYSIDDHISKIKKLYKKRRDLMIESIQQYFPTMVRCNRPQGGLFAWVELPSTINARKVLKKSLERNVAFVPGGSFFPNTPRENTFRINFSNMPEKRIVDGIERLGSVLGDFI